MGVSEGLKSAKGAGHDDRNQRVTRGPIKRLIFSTGKGSVYSPSGFRQTKKGCLIVSVFDQKRHAFLSGDGRQLAGRSHPRRFSIAIIGFG